MAAHHSKRRKILRTFATDSKFITAGEKRPRDMARRAARAGRRTTGATTLSHRYRFGQRRVVGQRIVGLHAGSFRLQHDRHDFKLVRELGRSY